MKLKIIFMQENHFYSSAPLYSNLWKCCWDVPWPLLFLTSSEVLRTCFSVCHYLMCYGWRCASFSSRKFCFLKNFLPFSLFSLEFWLSPVSDKWKSQREQDWSSDFLLFVLILSFCSVIFFLFFFFEREIFIFQLFLGIVLKLLFSFSTLFVLCSIFNYGIFSRT